MRELGPPPARGSLPDELTHGACQANVYCPASDGVRQPLWRSDGTAPGSFMVNITLASVVPTSLTLAGEPLYGSLAGDAPDSSFDRADGRDLLAIRRSSNPWQLGFSPCEPAALGGELSLPQNRGNELRRTDDSSIATLTVDPTADPTIEANETGRSTSPQAAVTASPPQIQLPEPS